MSQPARLLNVPHDPEAEQAFVGAMLLSPVQLDAMAQVIQPEDLYLPELAALYRAILALRDSGTAIDGITLRDQMGAAGPSDARLRELSTFVPVSGHVGAYAGIITEHAGRRRLLSAAERIRLSALDTATPYLAAQGLAQDALRWADLPAGGAPSPTADEVASLAHDHDWIIPGLLERMDRLLLVAGEGHGKSLLLAQLAVQLAAGIHPWTLQPIEPTRTLLVDLENPPRILARRFSRLRGAAGEWDPDLCRVESRPEGLDVTQRGDAQWLMDRIASNRPDTLIIGPIYKLHEVEEEKAAAVRQVQKVIDTIRARYRCAVLMETHAPHESFLKGNQLRPSGSRLWIRWPEFVLGLAPISRDKLDGVWLLDHVRPPRERRAWPSRVRRGGAWPWHQVTMG